MFTAAIVTIASANFDRTIDFYTQFLEIAPQGCIPNVYAEFRLPGLRLAIFCPHPNNRAEFSHPHQSGMSICLEVDSVEDAIAKLTQLGYSPSGSITVASHGREIYAYDPDGNRLILHQGA
ncbi:VOC family protein [Chamaesiphon sp. VAR_69_metabat_338]|uniref:VOC family protein n=1 Tax=Chamaesiphon sp. VAR_69_metabat_338 TaxID=2964704 RepID=UPI00286E8E07|nr:VOC family protein [Chamaesiphon sp. VAR_69_metabat_338]